MVGVELGELFQSYVDHEQAVGLQVDRHDARTIHFGLLVATGDQHFTDK